MKPAVVDHLVGFLREGSSDEKLESLTEVVIPTNAGSLLRRTCSGMSEKEKIEINQDNNMAIYSFTSYSAGWLNSLGKSHTET